MGLLRVLLFFGGLRLPPTLGLLQDPPTIYEGPAGSYFGFALDFHMSEGRPSVAVGAPRANTSQPGVAQPGAVFLCSWPPDKTPCHPLPIDTAGNESESQGALELHTYKSDQWLGASVTSWDGKLVVCAPLQHWNAIEGQQEAFRTPTGTCFVWSPGQRRTVWYSPCRDQTMASTYRQRNYVHDKRYCEIGFSAAVTPDGTLVLGAPGGYYFTGESFLPALPPWLVLPGCSLRVGTAGGGHPDGWVPRQCWCSPTRCPPGLVYSVELDKILRRFLGTSLLWLGSPGRPTEPVSGAYEDGYRGYSVAVGEFDGNPKTKEYVVGVPNKSNTRGEVEIFTAGDTLRLLRGIASEQVASYFGHTVAVADVDGDGRDDLLVGAPLYMARGSDGQRSELGRLYVYLGRGQQPLAGPPQTLTGTHPYGRFAAAIASLGDLDKDGFGDVAVGAPQGGDSGSGQVLIFRGQSEGLAPVPTQRLNSPFPGPAAFGFALRGATDLDGNGYADLLVGAYGAAKVAVYQGLPVVVAQTQLSVPDGLNPEILDCDLPDSSVRVSCFHVVFCVSVKGQHLPQSIHLEAELQLDRLKPRPSRRVLLLQGHQSSWQEELVVAPGTPPVCSNLTAYLRDKAEFKDKLSPVALSVSLTLPREAPGLVLYGQTLVQAQTHLILEDCGDDNLCVPDLHLAADTPSQRLLIGAEAALSLRANATNAGEGAFEAELRVQLPPGTHYQAARSTIPGQEKLSCNPKKENGTHVVLCELGNPMKAGARITVDMELSVSGLEDMGDAITFHLQLRSKNSLSHSNASVTVTVPVEAEAEMQLRGNSLPAITVLPTSWHWVEGSQRPEDHGIKVEHVYELHNEGPGTVSGVTLSLAIPHLLGDRVLLYLLELGTEGGLNCSHHPALNPAQLGISSPTAAAPGNGSHQRERREAEPPPAGLGDFVRVDCDNATCVDIICHVPSLGKDQRALVSVHALLWMDTLQQREHLLTQFLIQSQAWFSTSAMPYRVQPRVLPTGKAQTDTRVVRASLGAEGAVPVWWVVLGVLAGLLLLTLLILLMWKTGFFKRTRPPAEGDTQEEPGRAQEPGSSQEPGSA
ncbi:PREDICTED: integrin alpha-IIb [Sturnus vulgaris]|uniref:integrin alpha-IIb n=1 Tax=Sturnus vulgaris TaxID=9172 RepID=UPI00071A6D52|nr:PREDICTED: integrin alpha-IIb [Sturnus vulgaris]